MSGILEADNVPERRGVYLLTHPRSASNLLQTMMEKQPGYQNSEYKLFDAGFATLNQLQRGPLSEWPEEDRKDLLDKFTAGWDSLQDEIANANKNGLQAFIKEHTHFLRDPTKFFSALYPTDTPNLPSLNLHERNVPPSTSARTNPTSLPDSFLLSMQPIFQIRHPALMFPSMYRALKTRFVQTTSEPLVAAILTLSHSRALYDWYTTHAPASRLPRVIDADDIMNSPAAVRRLCEQTGLSAEHVLYEWDERAAEDPVKKVFLSTIYASKGIVKGKDASALNVAAEREKWVGEWGVDDAQGIARFVDEAMADYEYLHSRRTTGSSVA
ncbi:hypothetical protein BDU57DRAFT_518183 [Ampelomyces quisqualis]|uniref:P-loop containing nucleoside triphosphate hydrolase protein n=1 Tax=Ampelomyces quisqualis TaxID=50730 RepID=A0A6A5QKB1_AMPQU|nr:hypothetical protein BDU57DRAFT_518183 [Ampelomyces quisqualis]